MDVQSKWSKCSEHIFKPRTEVCRYYALKEHSTDEGLAWEVFLQGLDVTSGELVNEARKEFENPFTIPYLEYVLHDIDQKMDST